MEATASESEVGKGNLCFSKGQSQIRSCTEPSPAPCQGRVKARVAELNKQYNRSLLDSEMLGTITNKCSVEKVEFLIKSNIKSNNLFHSKLKQNLAKVHSGEYCYRNEISREIEKQRCWLVEEIAQRRNALPIPPTSASQNEEFPYREKPNGIS